MVICQTAALHAARDRTRREPGRRHPARTHTRQGLPRRVMCSMAVRWERHAPWVEHRRLRRLLCVRPRGKWLRRLHCLIFPPGRCHSTRSPLLSTVVAAPVQGCSATRERQKPDPMMDKAMGAMEAGKTRSRPQKQQQVSYLVVTAHPCALRNLDRDVAQTMPRSNRRRHISWQRLTHAC